MEKKVKELEKAYKQLKHTYQRTKTNMKNIKKRIIENEAGKKQAITKLKH